MSMPIIIIYVIRQADIVAALTLEAMQGSHKAFDARIHKARPHKGQNVVAKRMRQLLLQLDDDNVQTGSEIAESHRNCNRVQGIQNITVYIIVDSYTLRCIPQVHGIVHDTVAFVMQILNTELNSATGMSY